MMNNKRVSSHTIYKLIEASADTSTAFIFKNPLKDHEIFAIYCCDCIVHVVDLLYKGQELVSRECKLRKTFKLTSSINKIIHWSSAECIVFQTVDGELWKIGYDFILHDSQAITSLTSTDNEIVSILTEPEIPKDPTKGNINQIGNNLFQQSKISCLQHDDTVVDVVLFNNELVIAEKHEKQLSLCILDYKQQVVQKKLVWSCYFEDCSSLVTNESIGIIPHSKSTSIWFVQCCVPGNANNSCLQLDRLLFTSVFGHDETILDPIAMIVGLADGKIMTKIMNRHVIQADKGSSANFNQSRLNILCDLAQPLIDVCTLQIEQIKFTEPQPTTQVHLIASSQDISEVESKINKSFSQNAALIIVGKYGKVLIYLPQHKEYHLDLPNHDQLIFPIVSMSANTSCLIVSTGKQINVYQLVLSVNIGKEGVITANPLFELLLCIPNVTGVNFAKDPHGICQLSNIEHDNGNQCMWGTNGTGSLIQINIYDIFSSEKKSASSFQASVKSLLKSLESSQNHILSLKKIQTNQNFSLARLHLLSNLMIDHLSSNCSAHLPGKTSLQSCSCVLRCDVRDVSIGLDRSIVIEAELRNNSTYLIRDPGYLSCMVNCCKAISVENNISNKILCKSYRVPMLQPGSSMKYRMHLSTSYSQLKLPFTLMFNLIVQLPGPLNEFDSSMQSNAKPAGLVVPINCYDVTILNFLHPISANPVPRIPHFPAELPTHLDEMCLCGNTMPFTINQPHKIAQDRLRRADQEDLQMSHGSKSQDTFKIIIYGSFVSDFLDKNMVDDLAASQKALISKICKYFIPNATNEKQDDQLQKFHYELPCRRRITLEFQCIAMDNVIKEKYFEVALFIRGGCLQTLCQVHEAICRKIQNVNLHDLKEFKKSELVSLLNQVKTLMNTWICRDLFDYEAPGQSFERMLDLMLQCRMIQFP